jgi:hypothetical protein
MSEKTFLGKKPEDYVKMTHLLGKFTRQKVKIAYFFTLKQKEL